MGEKNVNSENEDIFDKDASLLFDEELNRYRNERQQEIKHNVTSPEAEARRESKQKFYERILSAFEEAETNARETAESCYDIAGALKNLLLKSKSRLYYGARIFADLRFLISLDEERFINAAPSDRQGIVMGHLYESLHSNGVDYCIERLREQIDESNLPKSLVGLTDLKKRITEDVFSIDFETNQLYFTESLIVEAATKLIKAVERSIKMEVDEIAISKQLGLSANDKTSDESFDENISTNLTKRQWVIAFRFFIDRFKLGSIENITFARLLTVINNGKNLQDFRTMLGNRKGLITAKTSVDARRIADLFRESDMTEIADEIESAINRINSN